MLRLRKVTSGRAPHQVRVRSLSCRLSCVRVSETQMPNAKDTDLNPTKRILLVGPTGSGKTAQIWTLPGKRFAYIFDPNSLSTLKGCDVDYEEFYPDFLEMDATLKGFNKGSLSDKMPAVAGRASKREPLVYMKWVDDVNKK